MKAATKMASDALSIRQRTCQDCGMLLNDAGEFHPMIFCEWKKQGRDPWEHFSWLVERVYGVKPPKRPPLARSLPITPVQS